MALSFILLALCVAPAMARYVFLDLSGLNSPLSMFAPADREASEKPSSAAELVPAPALAPEFFLAPAPESAMNSPEEASAERTVEKAAKKRRSRTDLKAELNLKLEHHHQESSEEEAAEEKIREERASSGLPYLPAPASLSSPASAWTQIPSSQYPSPPAINEDGEEGGH